MIKFHFYAFILFCIAVPAFGQSPTKSFSSLQAGSNPEFRSASRVNALDQNGLLWERKLDAAFSGLSTPPTPSDQSNTAIDSVDIMRWGSYTRTTFDGHVPPLSSEIKTVPFLATMGTFAGAIVALHIYQLHAWWSADRGPFHFQEDWPIDLQVDKFGHFYGAYMIGYFSRETLLESGLSDEAASDWGAVMGLTYQLYVETEDGFSTKWGFSPTDAYADIAGAAYFFAQKHVPVLQNFHEKWSYIPSSFLGKGNIPGQTRTAFDDYEGQTFWWTADVWNLLPPDWQSHYPNWLQLAVGYSAKHYGSIPSDVPDTREVFLALDYHLIHLLPQTDVPVLKWFIQTFDNFHFPAPALQIVPEGKFYILYPIKFHIGSREF